MGTAVQGFIPGLGEPAWDVWMLYRPGVVWEEGSAPEPDWWEHQLGRLSRDLADRRLDARRFADKTEELLTP